MQRKKICLATLFVFITSLCQAGKVDLSLTGGAAFSRPSNNTTLQLNQFVTSLYVNDEKNQAGFFAGIGIGHTFEQIYHKPLNLSLNLMLYDVSFGHVTGTEQPFVSGGDFDTLEYKFRVRSYPLMIMPRLIFTSFSWQPFIFGGLGVSWNRAYDYQEKPTDSSLGAAPATVPFNDKTIAAFAYQVGLGIQHQIYQNIKQHITLDVAMDYHYMNLGTGQLGTIPAETTDDHLKVPRLSAQALAISLNASLG